MDTTGTRIAILSGQQTGNTRTENCGGDVHVLYFSSGKNENEKSLKGIIRDLVPDEQLNICQTVETLSAKLRQPRLNPFIAIVKATDEAELNSMIDLGELFSDCRLFLILPDRKAETIVKGHSLRPRFLTYADNDFIRGTAVLKKMLDMNHIPLRDN